MAESRDVVRFSTLWTRVLGGLTTLAVLLYVLAAVLLPWRPGVRPLLLTPLLAALVCGVGWLLACWCAPWPSPAPPAAPSDTPPPPRPADLRAANRKRRRTINLRVGRFSVATLLGLGAVLSLPAAFAGPPPELASRQTALLAAGELGQDIEPALTRTSGLIWVGVLLLITLVVALVTLNAKDPTNAELETFLAAEPRWYRARSGARITVDLPIDEIIRGQDGDPDTTTEFCARLDLVGSKTPAAFRGPTPDQGPGWLAWDTSTRRAVFVHDGGSLVWGELRDRLPTPPTTEPPAAGTRELHPEPGLLNLGFRTLLTLLGLWLGGWAVYQLLNTTDTTLTAEDIVESLVIFPLLGAVLLALAASALIGAGFGIAHLTRRFRG